MNSKSKYRHYLKVTTTDCRPSGGTWATQHLNKGHSDVVGRHCIEATTKFRAGQCAQKVCYDLEQSRVITFLVFISDFEQLDRKPQKLC